MKQIKNYQSYLFPVSYTHLFIVSRSHPYFEKVFHIYDELNSVVQENLAGIRVVKSFICL